MEIREEMRLLKRCEVLLFATFFVERNAQRVFLGNKTEMAYFFQEGWYRLKNIGYEK